MFAALAALAALWPHSSANPTAAAALTVLAAAPPPLPPNRHDPALQAIAPHLTDDQRAASIAALAQPLLKAGIQPRAASHPCLVDAPRQARASAGKPVVDITPGVAQAVLRNCRHD